MTDNKQLINYDDNKLIEIMKRTVAVGLLDEEFTLFTQFCKATGLNAFKKEVWAIKVKGRLQIMTGINGYLTIANNHPQFDGMTVDVETDQKGLPIKAICKVYRKDRKYPSVGIALMREFNKGTPPWQDMPTIMLTKVAKSIAIREAFPSELGGSYTIEEMPKEYATPDVVAPVEAHARSIVVTEPLKAIPSTTTKEDIYRYKIPNPTEKTLMYFKKRGGYYDEPTGLFVAPRPLEAESPMLTQYRELDIKFSPDTADVHYAGEAHDRSNEEDVEL
jgi:phage recombination protein Bet